MIERELEVHNEEKKEVLTPESAREQLKAIWIKYYSKQRRTPDDEAEHRTAMTEFYSRITPEVDSYLQYSEIINGREVTMGMGIREQAYHEATSKNTVFHPTSPKSPGERRNIRRTKALQRRGTPPGLIR